MTLTTDAPVIDHERDTLRTPLSAWRRYAPDAVLVAALVVIALLTRWHGLPTDGLWLDDSVTAASVKASLWHLLTVGFDHPGFTVWLMGWSRVTGSGDSSLAYPALIAGTLGPGVLYLALRRFGFARSIAALLGAALVASQTDIVYSGRVKTYTIDVLIVVGLALVVPRLARTRWRWQTGLLWVTAAILLASFSSFALLATAAAGVVLVLHPASDLKVRAVAVGIQEAVHLAFLLAGFGGRFSYSTESLNVEWRRTWDAFVSFDLNPLRFGAAALRHLARIAEVFPGGPDWFATSCALIALVGLAAAALGRNMAVRSRYLVLVLAIAFLGGVLGKFPFGPKTGSAISNGGRVSLWLAPVLAVGLAAVLQPIRHWMAARRGLGVGFDTVVYSTTALVLVLALGRPTFPYPYAGARSATDYVETQLGPQDAVLTPWPDSTYSFAAESRFSAKMEPQPIFIDPRVQSPDQPKQWLRDLGGADRVFVYLSDPPEVLSESRPGATISSALRDLGFRPHVLAFQNARVEVWRRGLTAADRLNLTQSDLSPGWRETPGRASPQSIALFACLRVPGPITDQSVVDVAGPGVSGHPSGTSEVTVWSTPAALQTAYRAVNRSDARACVQSTLRSAFLSIGYPTSVEANRVPAPAAGGNPAVAYAATVKTPRGKRVLVHETLEFVAQGTTGIFVDEVSNDQQPFPSSVFSGLAAILAARASSPPPAMGG